MLIVKMKRIFWMAFLCICLSCVTANAEDKAKAAQPEAKSSLQQRAEAASESNNIALARSSYIRAYEDYVSKGQLKQGVQCGVKGTALYYKENYYKEAFDLLRRIDQSIISAQTDNASGLHYLVTKERMQIYMKLRKTANAQEQLGLMEKQAAASGEEQIQNDLLYTKALFYYTSGQNEKGNAVFKEMVGRLTGSKEYGKVDEVYRTLIDNGRRSGSANLVAQAYTNYIAWKDSVAELKRADEVGALNQQIEEKQTAIEDRDSSLKSRNRIIIGLGLLLAALAAVLVAGALILLRFIILTRKQKKTIRLANESNALKAQFISNIAAQLTPNLKKLGEQKPEVKALLDFSEHIQTLSRLETAVEEKVETEETALQPFCEELVSQVRDKVRSGISLVMEVPKTSLPINREYVSHILLHLLENATYFTPDEGHIKLEFKKRSAHKCQFLVSNTGSFIPEEKRDDVFKPFLDVRDLTEGDGLGLAICRQMALKMNGDIIIDPEFTKGTRFILNLIM